MIVKNITATAEPPTHKVLTDFFSFCGNIAALSITPQGDEPTVVAIVTFETEAAAKTAVLLNNALINDRPISVEIAPSGFVAPTSSVSADQLPHSAQGQRSETSVIQALLDSGYKLSNDAIAQAKTFDEQTGITQTLASGFAAISATVAEIDNSWQISEKAKAVGDSITSTATEVDQTYQISTKAGEVGTQALGFLQTAAGSIATGASTAADSVTTFVNTNPQINQGLQTIQVVGSNIGQSIADTFGGLFSALSPRGGPTSN